jgi:hypothetical protein
MCDRIHLRIKLTTMADMEWILPYQIRIAKHFLPSLDPGYMPMREIQSVPRFEMLYVVPLPLV